MIVHNNDSLKNSLCSRENCATRLAILWQYPHLYAILHGCRLDFTFGAKCYSKFKFQSYY